MRKNGNLYHEEIGQAYDRRGTFINCECWDLTIVKGIFGLRDFLSHFILKILLEKLKNK